MKKQTKKNAFKYSLNGNGWQFYAKDQDAYASGLAVLWHICEEIRKAVHRTKEEGQPFDPWEETGANQEKRLARRECEKMQRQAEEMLLREKPALRFTSNPQALKDAKEEAKRKRHLEACKRYREKKRLARALSAKGAKGGKGGKGGKRSK